MAKAGFARKMQGKTWVFGDKMDVDWEIISFETLRRIVPQGQARTEELLGKYCMVEVDPDFPNKVKTGDFIVAGRNFGYGHDHDGSCMAILGAGIPAVICESSNGNFIRNSVHHGLAVVQCPGITEAVNEGDTLELDLELGRVTNLRTEEQLQFPPYPSFLLELIEANGLYPQLRAQLAAT